MHTQITSTQGFEARYEDDVLVLKLHESTSHAIKGFFETIDAYRSLMTHRGNFYTLLNFSDSDMVLSGPVHDCLQRLIQTSGGRTGTGHFGIVVERSQAETLEESLKDQVRTSNRVRIFTSYGAALGWLCALAAAQRFAQASYA